MIQRIQTVYLVLGALASGALFLFDPLWGGAVVQRFGWFTPAAAALAGAAAAGALATVFLYGNRARQRTVTAGLQVLAALLTGLFFGGFYGAGALGLRGADGALDFGKLTFWALPVVAYIFFLLARRAIQSDIDLVRSMDRLR
jgi:hypothetical protein